MSHANGSNSFYRFILSSALGRRLRLGRSSGESTSDKGQTDNSPGEVAPRLAWLCPHRAVQDEGEELFHPPASIESVDELVEVSLEVLGLTPWKVPFSQVLRFPNTL